MESSSTSGAGFLHGGGAMGKIIRSYDWSNNPLGVPDQWPQSLRTTLSIILNSKFPMFLFWGPELICFYNDAYRPSLGNNGKHPGALGSKGADLWPEIWDFIKPLIDRVLSTGDATWNEDQLLPIYRNGRMEEVYWTFSYSPVNDETGKPAGVFVTCSETTEKVKNLNVLKEKEEQLSFAINAAELGTWDHNPATGKFTGNERLKEWFGLKPEEEIPLSLAVDAMAEKDRKRVSDAIEKAMNFSSGGSYDIEYTIVNPLTKKEIVVAAKGRAWFDEEKKPYRFNGTLEDVTEQSTARKKLEEAEAKNRLTIEAADLGTFEIDLITRKLYGSVRFDEIYDVNNSEAHNKYIAAIHPDDLEVRAKAYENAALTGVMDYEARVVWRNGSVHWVRAMGKMYFDESGKPLRVLGVVQDVTEKKENEAKMKLFSEELSRQVKERTVELNRSNEDLLQFAHVSSHDLKEPVRKIKIYSNKIQEQFGETLPDEGKQALEKVQKAADRMLDMIEGVLTFSSVKSSEEPAVKIDLNVLFENIQSDLEILIAQKNATLRINAMPQLEGAAVLIYQMFYNIVYNALKFSKINTHSLIIVSSSLKKMNGADYAVIKVSDNGIGFGQKYAEQIFTTFSRLNAKDQYEGTGLGLALCRRIAERHHGSITAEGIEGEGAVFTVTLPVKAQIK